MKLSHVSPRHPAQAPHRSLQRRQGGYVTAMVGLLMVPLMLFAALGVDAGGLYLRAASIQRAADAAALAGVVWMPNLATATTYAQEAAKKNGLDDADSNISVTASRVAGNDRQLSVTITDTAVPTVFGQVATKTTTITRSAVAEYVMPVPLGSPDNRFGNDPTTGYVQNLWGNIHGPTTDSTKGDVFAAGCDVGTGDNCGSTSNTNYRGYYLYTVDVTQAGLSLITVQVYDAGLYPRSSENVDTGDSTYSSDAGVTTNWTMYDTDNTPLDVSDNPTINTAGGQSCSTGLGAWTLPELATTDAGASTYLNKWATICKISNPPVGQYYLKVATTGGSGANRYSLRVQSSGTGNAGVQLYAHGDFSMYNNAATATSTSSANFYLADVEPVQAGKTFQVDMFDPGEVSKADGSLANGGNAYMQVNAPGGTTAVSSCTIDAPGSSSYPTLTTISPCKFQTSSSGSALFNGKWVHVQIPLASTYTCTTDCWWKIQYTFDLNSQANDTTTWAASIVGNPVHLTS